MGWWTYIFISILPYSLLDHQQLLGSQNLQFFTSEGLSILVMVFTFSVTPRLAIRITLPSAPFVSCAPIVCCAHIICWAPIVHCIIPGSMVSSLLGWLLTGWMTQLTRWMTWLRRWLAGLRRLDISWRQVWVDDWRFNIKPKAPFQTVVLLFLLHNDHHDDYDDEDHYDDDSSNHTQSNGSCGASLICSDISCRTSNSTAVSI